MCVYKSYDKIKFLNNVNFIEIITMLGMKNFCHKIKFVLEIIFFLISILYYFFKD